MYPHDYPIGTTVTDGIKHFHRSITVGGAPVWYGTSGACGVLPEEYKVVYQPEPTFKVGDVILKAKVLELPEFSVVASADSGLTGMAAQRVNGGMVTCGYATWED